MKTHLALRVGIAACLLVEAVVHLRLAGGYQAAQPGGIGEGNLFRLEAVVALLVAAWVLLRGSRASYVAAAVVGLSALAVVILTRFVDIGAVGPIPSMYEPVWFRSKTVSAVAEGLAGLLALVALATPVRDRASR